jgi:hypothetical protein
MKRRKTGAVLLFLISLLLIALPCGANADEGQSFKPPDIIGSYTYSHKYGAEEITLADSQKGLRVGMKLFVYEGSGQSARRPSMFSGLEVISVEETTARVSVGENVKIGDKVSTKYKPPKIN